MSESDVESETGSGIKVPRFNGKRDEDYSLWRLRLRAAFLNKGVWKVVEPTSTFYEASDSQSQTTAPGPALSAVGPLTTAKVENASGIIICKLGYVPLRVVLDDNDDPRLMLQLLDAQYASNRTVFRIAVQTQLLWMRYTSQNMSSYVDKYASLFSQLERMGQGAASPKSHKAPILLASIDPGCVLESTSVALRAKEVSGLTWDYVTTTLIDEYYARRIPASDPSRNKRDRNRRRRKSQSSGKNRGNPQDNDGSDSDASVDFNSTTKAIAAALKMVQNECSGNKPPLHCDYCDRPVHSKKRCQLNPESFMVLVMSPADVSSDHS